MLYLVTHFVEVPSSRVPLAVIVLNDAIKRKSLPPNLKCRMVIPSTGNYSASVWDASSAEELQQWIDGNLMDGVAHIAEIPEDFTYGLALELTTARAAEKVATSSKTTLERINTTGVRVMETVAEKLDRLDQRTHLITATREATSAAVTKVRAATDRALENEGVQKSLASISSSLQSAGTSMGRAFSWMGSKVKGSFPGVAGATTYSAFGHDGTDSASPYDAVYTGSDPNFMPVSTNAARPSGDEAGDMPAGAGAVWGTSAGAPAEEAVPMPHFTLQDEGYSSPQETPSKDFDSAEPEPAAPAPGTEAAVGASPNAPPAQIPPADTEAPAAQLPVSAPVS